MIDEPELDEIDDKLDATFGVVLRLTADRVELDPGAPLGDCFVVSRGWHHVAVADDDSPGVDALLGEQIELW